MKQKACHAALLWLSLLLVSIMQPSNMAHTAGDARRAADERKLIQQCQMIAGDKARLACFDDAAKQLAPPRFQGRLGHITEPFKLTSPHRLRFKSYGAIFVLYLRGDKGQVLQNLHLGGGGEDSYEIKKPGTYSLKIHGSAAWAIWLEPLELPPNNHKLNDHPKE